MFDDAREHEVGLANVDPHGQDRSNQAPAQNVASCARVFRERNEAKLRTIEGNKTGRYDLGFCDRTQHNDFVAEIRMVREIAFPTWVEMDQAIAAAPDSSNAGDVEVLLEWWPDIDDSMLRDRGVLDGSEDNMRRRSRGQTTSSKTPRPSVFESGRAWLATARPRRLVLTVGVWMFMALLAWCVISIVFGVTRIASVTVLLQSVLPIAFVPVWIIGVIAAWQRRWVTAMLAVALAIAHVALLAPAIGSASVPNWAAKAPTLTVFSANLWDQNPVPQAAAKRVLASTADVLILVEVSPAMRSALNAAGLNTKFPHQLLAAPARSGDTDGVYSRLPFERHSIIADWGNELPMVRIARAHATIDIVGLHVDGALHGRLRWKGEIRGLIPLVKGSTAPLALIGDFNATRWNPPLRDLLNLGLHDAHEDRGLGLSNSWPVRDGLLGVVTPLMRLDHALVNSGVAVRAVRDIEIPGDDHLAFETTLALRCC